MEAPGSVNTLGNGQAQAQVPGLAGFQVQARSLAVGMGLPIKRRPLGRQVARTTPHKRIRESSLTGLFNPAWRFYGQMDQELHIEALNRADPGSWTGWGQGAKTSHDKDMAMALAFDCFNDSPLETQDSAAWFVMMAQKYIALGRRLAGKSQAQMLQEGQAIVEQHQAAAMLQHEAQQAHTQQDQAQAQAQAFVIPDMGVLHQDPSGRHFAQSLGRSRYLNREASGGAEDWLVEPDGTIKSPAKGLAIHIVDLLSAGNLAEAWPAGTGASASSSE